jgi:hypothetical protein
MLSGASPFCTRFNRSFASPAATGCAQDDNPCRNAGYAQDDKRRAGPGSAQDDKRRRTARRVLRYILPVGSLIEACCLSR